MIKSRGGGVFEFEGRCSPADNNTLRERHFHSAKALEQGLKFRYKFQNRHLKSLLFSRTGQIHPKGSPDSEKQ